MEPAMPGGTAAPSGPYSGRRPPPVGALSAYGRRDGGKGGKILPHPCPDTYGPFQRTQQAVADIPPWVKKSGKAAQEVFRMVQSTLTLLEWATNLSTLDDAARVLEERTDADAQDIEEVPKDGDCQFSAVAHQLELRGVCSSAAKQRRLVCDFLAENRERFEPFVATNYDEYLRQLSEGAWGDHVTLHALAVIHQTPVKVWSSLMSWKSPKVLHPLWLTEEPPASAGPIQLGHLHEYHYVSVVPREPQQQAAAAGGTGGRSTAADEAPEEDMEQPCGRGAYEGRVSPPPVVPQVWADDEDLTAPFQVSDWLDLYGQLPTEMFSKLYPSDDSGGGGRRRRRRHTTAAGGGGGAYDAAGGPAGVASCTTPPPAIPAGSITTTTSSTAAGEIADTLPPQPQQSPGGGQQRRRRRRRNYGDRMEGCPVCGVPGHLAVECDPELCDRWIEEMFQSNEGKRRAIGLFKRGRVQMVMRGYRRRQQHAKAVAAAAALVVAAVVAAAPPSS